MSRSAEQLWAMLREAENLPYGAARTAAVEQVVRHGDAIGDRELAFSARMEATQAYTYGGEPAKSFVTFSWCLSEFDSDPQPYHRRWEHHLLWYFKHMVTALTKFPEVPLARTYAVLDDMERRYREGGHSMQAVHKHRFTVARHVGDEAEADRLYELWITTPRDELSDCVGCDPSGRVGYLADRNRDEEAIALAEPVLAGRLTCHEQPQNILRGLMVPYLRTGRLDEAADAHRRSYRLMRGNLADLWDIGDHVEFCARSGNEHRGLEIVRRHIDWLDIAPSPAAGMSFAAATALLLRRLIALGHGGATVSRQGRADVTAEELAEELAAYATALSLRFDERNGTTARSTEVADTLNAEPYDRMVPLSPTARRAQPAAPVVTEPVPEVPADADAEGLLTQAEQQDDQERFQAAAVTLDTLDERFPDGLTPAQAARRAILYGSRRWVERDLAGTVAAWRQAVELFEAAGVASSASTARGRLGLALLYTGAVDEGVPLIEADAEYQEEHGDPARRAGARTRLSAAFAAQELYAEADAAQDRADEAAAETGDKWMRARFAVRRAQNRAALGRLDEARQAATEAADFYREHGPAHRLATACTVLGRVTHDAEQARTAYDEALRTGEPAVALDARIGRARCLMELNRPGEAVADYVEAVALFAEDGSDEGGAFLLELARAYYAADRPVEAAEVAEEAVLWLDRHEHTAVADNARLTLANAYRKIGDNTSALARYDELIERLAGNPAGVGQIREYSADLLYRMDRDAEAAERFAAGAADLRAADDPIGELRLLRRRVEALHWTWDVDAALAAVQEAVRRHADLADRVGEQPAAVWEKATLHFEAARILGAAHRFAEALEFLADVPEQLRAIDQQEDADQAEALRADLRQQAEAA